MMLDEEKTAAPVAAETRTDGEGKPVVTKVAAPEPGVKSVSKTAKKPAKKAAKKATAKKPAKKAGAKRGGPRLDQEAKVLWTGKDNPFREGSGAHERTEIVRKASGQKVGTVVEKVGRSATLHTLMKRGLVKLQSAA
jgi:hypothetical protein